MTNKSKLHARQIDVESKAFVVPKKTPQKRLHESVVNDIRLNSKASKDPTSSAGHNTSSGSALKLLPSAKVYSAINSKVQLVRIVLRLGVFSPLAAGPADAKTVARACSCTVKGMRALLEYVHSIHLPIAESEPPSEEVSLLNVALTAISGGAVYTVADYREWLQQSGFGEVRLLGDHWLAAYKA
jgi:hypothetical protein